MQWKEWSNFCATDWRGAVKSNDFILVFTDLEAAIQSYLKVMICLCKPDYGNGGCRCQKEIAWYLFLWLSSRNKI